MALAVLAVARLLAHEHHPRAGRALPEHRSLGDLMESAGGAALDVLA